MFSVKESGVVCKTCSKCKQSLPLNRFGLHNKTKDKLRTYCKECWNAYKHEWRIHNPDKFIEQQRRNNQNTKLRGRYKVQPLSEQRTQRLKRLYGLTDAQYESILAEQDGRCACCGRVPDLEPRVDHDHKTGDVRGILCHKCNVGIGLLGDTEDRVQLAVDYLAGKRHVCV